MLRMPGTFSLPPRVSDPDMHHGTCVTHVPWSMPGSLTSGFLWSRSQGKRSRHSQHKRNLRFNVTGMRPMVTACCEHAFDIPELLFTKRADVLPLGLEAARFGFNLFRSLWSLTGTSTAPRCCRDACQISERYDHYNTQYRGFETLLYIWR